MADPNAHYWLVSDKSGGNARVVTSVSKPQGGYVADLGPATQSRQELAQTLLQAAADAPSGLDITSVTLPGGGQTAIGQTGGVAGLLDKTATSINSVVDFLKLISWLFHPRNVLRAVEFLIGAVLMIFGLHAAFQARGERREGFTTSENALTRSELGRVATELGRSARGGGRPRRPASAPHVTRRRALAQRYTREERVRERERKGEKPAGHAKVTKGSGAGTRKAPRP